jgi:Na+-translocating ferredoxin:NAD+ oxidoreductase RnfC subunit
MLSLATNFGNPLIPLVLKGNRVSKNDVLAMYAKDDSMNVPLHAPMDAVVASVTPSAITLVDPYFEFVSAKF